MLESFSIAFLSIVFEAFPFVLLGTLISSLIEVYVPSTWISDRFKGRNIWQYLIAGLVGLIMPVCECAIVPIMRRLIKKGVPTGIALTFMLSAPIVNPVVMLSTYYAFTGDLKIVIARTIFGFLGAIIIGLLMERFIGQEEILKTTPPPATCSCGCSCGHDHSTDNPGLIENLKHVLSHTATEFIEVGRFLILGAIIAASMQTFVPRQMITIVSDNIALSILVMMLLAFVLSLCSEADAFIASTFRSTFPDAALLSFLIYGPMIDIKNTIMLTASFKAKFVIKLIVTITVVCCLLALIAGLIWAEVPAVRLY